MWMLAGSIYVGCKWLTWRRDSVERAPWWKHAGYLLAWPGMDATRFLTARASRQPSVKEWTSAVAKVVAGMTLFFGVARLAAPYDAFAAGWIGMAGIVMSVHFGVFHLLSCAWRAVGIDARSLMDRPLMSVSLGEFWGRRWNVAFRGLAHRFLFRPLAPWAGTRAAVLGGFLFSGVLHDLVISAPANAGYGGPTSYFVLQGLGVLLERSAFGQRFGLGTGRSGWTFTMAVVVAPVFMLFHPPFVNAIAVPFMRAVGAM